MLTLYLFILFALFLGWSAETFAPRRPLFAFAPVAASRRHAMWGWST